VFVSTHDRIDSVATGVGLAESRSGCVDADTMGGVGRAPDERGIASCRLWPRPSAGSTGVHVSASASFDRSDSVKRGWLPDSAKSQSRMPRISPRWTTGAGTAHGRGPRGRPRGRRAADHRRTRSSPQRRASGRMAPGTRTVRRTS